MKHKFIKSECKKSNWSRIIDEWFSVLDLASNLSNGTDSPYVHYEQGNSHALALAASNAGYASMREVCGNRLGKNEGRLDICFFDKERIECVEAKWDEFDGEENKKPPLKRLSKAVSDVDCFISKYELFNSKRTLHKTGVLFLTPHFKNPSNANVEHCIERVTENTDADIVAYYLNTNNRIKYFCEGRIYPGVFLIAKHIQ